MNISINNFDFHLKKASDAHCIRDINSYQENLKKASKILGTIIANGDINLALILEIKLYQLIKLEESEENYYEGFREHKNLFFEAGKLISPGNPKTGNLNNIAFIFNTSALLGHTEVAISIFKKWRIYFPDINIFYIAMTSSEGKKINSILKDLKVNIVTPDIKDDLSPFDLIKWTKQQIEINEIHTAVWVSIPIWVSFIFGYKIASQQILWALKFHPVHLGEQIMHIATSKFSHEKYTLIHKCPWLSFVPPLISDNALISSEALNETKNKYPKKFIFGTLARDEKFNSTIFISTIIAILKKCPNSIYLFSGRKPNQLLIDAAKENGLSDRVIFIGWVNTNLYSALLDVFLESFPFGCGITSMQAIKQGTRLVSLWAENTIPRWFFKNTEDASQFKPSWFVSSDIDDYINNAADLYEIFVKDNLLKKDFYASLNLSEGEESKNFLRLILKQ
jgi:glycosyltransferase involved in cell wall biosynthesis